MKRRKNKIEQKEDIIIKIKILNAIVKPNKVYIYENLKIVNSPLPVIFQKDLIQKSFVLSY